MTPDDTSGERTPKYGLSGTTRKPARIAANELSRAINALNAHHEAEPDALASSERAVRAALLGVHGREAAPIADRTDSLMAEAAGLRAERAELLQALLDMRGALADLLLEEHGSAPSEAMFTAHVEPDAGEPAPEPVGGAQLEAADAVRVLAATVGWTKRES